MQQRLKHRQKRKAVWTAGKCRFHAAFFVQRVLECKGGTGMKGKVIFLAAAMGTLWSATAFGAQFPDVPTDHWAYNEVVKASEIGFISGMDDGTFGLGQTVTRGQFVSMMCRMFGWELVDAKSGSFADNQDVNQWYFKSVETAAQHGALDLSLIHI